MLTQSKNVISYRFDILMRGKFQDNHVLVTLCIRRDAEMQPKICCREKKKEEETKTNVTTITGDG